MIVCICNNVSDRKIRQAVEAGMTSMVELRDHLDIGTCCGKCHPAPSACCATAWLTTRRRSCTRRNSPTLSTYRPNLSCSIRTPWPPERL